MAELMSVHGWGYPAMRTTTPTPSDPAHKRVSRSKDGRSSSPSKTVFRAKSSNALADMTSVSSPWRPSPSSLLEENSLNTLKDPRAASTSDLSSSSATSPRHPDLSNEMATLSDKLIQAINNQAMLDDTLSSTRQELEASRAKVNELEQQTRRHEEELSSGTLVKKSDVEAEKTLLRDSLEDERSRRIAVEKEKKGIEQELENLTAALFEEANKMVAAAKQEREAVERKNDQLKAQVKDTEMLVASHQEQLAELKSVMQQMNGEREDFDTKTNPSTAPTSPATAANQHDSINRLLGAMNMSPATPGSGDITPAPPTSFFHLIKSVCRTDIQAYDDFHALLHHARNSKPHSRVGSGSSYGGLNVMSLASFSTNNQSSQNQLQTNGTAQSGATAQTSSSNGLTASPRESSSPSVQLKETRFYKRVLMEDIEPALRLDIAPGISWLARRSVLSTICEGGLVIEPMPALALKYALPCSLCGERRNNGDNARLHRFRTSDSESAQRYPLCVVCLEKMRACCDFVGYLRLIVDGHVRVGDEEDEREAWEETIRLRERLFWSRIGGGVVPAFIQTADAARDEAAIPGHDSPQLRNDPGANQNGVLCSDPQTMNKNDDPFSSKADRASIGNTIISINGNVGIPQSRDAAKKQPEEGTNGPTEKDGAAAQTTHPTTNGDLQDARSHLRTPSKSGSVSSASTSKSANGADPSLKVAIPASFEL